MSRKKSERGQSLVIVALAFFVLVAVAALVIDGGILYLNRRNAQTAADAAALAGAREMCVENGTDSDIQTIVNQYAITENGATAVENVTIDRGNKKVAVQTRLETTSFFAIVLGYENNMVRSEASAGCYRPGTTDKLLPIAWTCQPPVGGSTDSCNIHAIPWSIFETLMTVVNFMGAGTNADMLLDDGDEATWESYHDTVGSKMTYLVMDSSTFSHATSCLPPIGTGTINCDFNGDGIPDVDGGANRGWLLLDGNGASDLVDLMLNGYPNPLTLPQWFPGKNGVSNSVFIQSHNIVGDISLVPVFNGVCSDTTGADLPSDCPAVYETGDLIKSGSGSGTYYRVAGFAPFIVTCVSKGTSEHCPAKRFAGIDNNISTIEGYFVDGYVAGTGIDPGGFDLGVYIISLTE